MRTSVFILCLVWITLLTGCHDHSDNTTMGPASVATTAPASGATAGTTAANVQGTWQGTVTSGSTATQATLVLSQSGQSFSGTFATPGATGNTSGSLTGNTLTIALTPVNPAVCNGQFSGTGTVNGDSMTLNLLAASSQAVRTTVSTGTVVIGNSVVSSTGTVTCQAASLSGQGQFSRVTTSASNGVTF